MKDLALRLRGRDPLALRLAGIETNLRYLRAVAAAPVFVEGRMVTRSLGELHYQPQALEVLEPVVRAAAEAEWESGQTLAVIGRSANSVGNVADIAASADGDVLWRSAGALIWSHIAVSSVSGAVPDTRIINELERIHIAGRDDYL